jgi:hypothetical protein
MSYGIEGEPFLLESRIRIEFEKTDKAGNASSVLFKTLV